MATYDIVMLIVILIAAFLGWQKGMAWQLASLAAIGVSFFVATNFGEQLAPQISIEDPFTQWLAAVVILYLGTSLAIWMVFRIVKTSIEQMKLKDFDRQMGALLGAAKGVAIVCIITMLLVGLPQGQQAVMQSRAGHYVHELVHRARPLLPESANQYIGKYMDQFEEQMHSLDPNYASQNQGYPGQIFPAQNPGYPGQNYPAQNPSYGNQNYDQPAQVPQPIYGQQPSAPTYQQPTYQPPTQPAPDHSAGPRTERRPVPATAVAEGRSTQITQPAPG